MKLLIHDYAGHPAPIDLSRVLAVRGHQVTHAYFAQDSGPKGALRLGRDDPKRLEFLPVVIDGPYSKTNLLRRRAGDRAYGKVLGRHIARVRPDLVISGNTPTEAQAGIVRACGQAGTRFVFWCQDVYPWAVARLLAQRMPLGIGRSVGGLYQAMERRQMQRSGHVVHISQAFCDYSDRLGIPRDRVSVIPNWGALAGLPVLPRDTAWGREMGLGTGKRFLYSGTLGLKHDPDLLIGLAQSANPGDQVIAVAAGVGADVLAAHPDLSALTCLPLQPFERLAEVLASADVLLAMIEPEAGTFSVPSKILSYLCAGRPIVLSAPRGNLAAQLVEDSGAGMVVAPGDRAGFMAAARAYADDPQAAARAGAAGRKYAEQNFDIARVADRFEDVFLRAVGGRS
ncbi:MAG: glycosyltransferase family 4 protein [Rhodobacteraceae bacterium]|nr:glycosyltransferase family 4 protein [Paracoccaceae bacterium]